VQSCITPATWKLALGLAEIYLEKMREDGRFTEGWVPCIDALELHIKDARKRIERLD
jgi:hypothetical protein